MITIENDSSRLAQVELISHVRSCYALLQSTAFWTARPVVLGSQTPPEW